MKKILQVVTVPLGYDGISAFVRRMTAAMDKSRLQVDFLAINEPDSAVRAELEGQGCKIHVVTGRMKNPVGYALRLAKIVRREKYDVVHVHGNSCTMAFDLLGARLGGAKIRAAHSHNTFCNFMAAHRLLRPLFDSLYTHAFACGTEAGNWLFRERPFSVIPNAVDVEKFAFDPAARDECRRELGIKDETAIAAVAHFSPQKNHSFMLDVFSEYHKIDPSAKLILVGQGPLKGEIEAKINRLGLNGSVILTGLRTDVPRLLSAFDVMLLPSLYEGFPTVLLEWQAAGLPAIVADTVTKSAAFTDYIQYLPISSGPAPWLNALIHLSPAFDRPIASAEGAAFLTEAGYSLQESAANLAKWYQGALPPGPSPKG